MTLEDPFYVVKDEVFKALNKTRGLYLRWQEISKTPTTPSSPEVEWTSTELKNALRSIEWDLEDLEDTISIVEKNSSKFKIDNKEISDRRTFIEATKQEVKAMKIRMNSNKNHDNDISAREPLLSVNSPVMPHFGMGFASTTPKYSKLANQADSPNRSRIDFYDDSNMQMQEKMLMDQEEQLQVINDSVGSLKTVSKQICIEIDEQAIMLDDLNVEMENTDSKLDSSIKKVAKILHLNNDRRQWLAIGVLLFLLVIMLILYVSKF